jgi:ATP-dependent RNA helicase CshB
LELHFKKPRRFDHETNEKIKQIIWKGSRTVKPGYKKKIKDQIQKIRQKVKHEYIEKRIHQTLMAKNIERTKKEKKW